MKGTILLIDDNPNILDNLTEFLELEGFKIIGTNNGKEGIRLANEHKPDLIICDTLMPEMDGYEVLKHLLASPVTYEIPFIFSTSLSEKTDRAAALELGADDYIIKPFELDNLLKMVHLWLEKGSVRKKEV